MAASRLDTLSAESTEGELEEVQFASAGSAFVETSEFDPSEEEPPAQPSLFSFPAASYLYYQGGTLVLREVGQEQPVHPLFQWVKGRWRCEGYHLPELLPWLRENRIRNSVQRWQSLHLTFHDSRQPHDFQLEALRAWDRADRLGSIVLPTGSGKTFVAIQAIQRVGASTVVVAPTIDLLHQWYARLVNAFCPNDTGYVDSDSPNQTDNQSGNQSSNQIKIGVYYGKEKQLEPITVTTYHSAGDFIADYGNHFKLIIYDEVHHLPAPAWGETALMSPAPFRLGLTATYPEADEQEGGRWRVDDLIGPIVYEKRIEELVGTRLAEYRTERVRIELTSEERKEYDADYAIYADFLSSRQLAQTYGRNWYLELMRLGSQNPEARRAILARQRIQRLLAQSEAKMHMLDNLLREHVCEQVLVFTENNDVAYQIARRHLIPALTHETKAAERKLILDKFQSGDYSAIVTSKVLNEGVDVPEAKVAIVLGGNAGAREYIQRLGRILRKVGNRQAVLYEVIVRDTVDEGRSQRRSSKLQNFHRNPQNTNSQNKEAQNEMPQQTDPQLENFSQRVPHADG
ncbi:MAG: DEAD/DEAH box helicase [Chloroflexota bacterium]